MPEVDVRHITEYHYTIVGQDPLSRRLGTAVFSVVTTADGTDAGARTTGLVLLDPEGRPVATVQEGSLGMLLGAALAILEHREVNVEEFLAQVRAHYRLL